MQQELIGYQGSYRYESKTALDTAIARARAHLAEEELEGEEAWVRYFVSNGTRLTVNLNVPDSPEQRFIAANVFLILADGAVDGAVAARRGETTLDVFAGGEDE